jgi:hypothetical protein
LSGINAVLTCLFASPMITDLITLSIFGIFPLRPDSDLLASIGKYPLLSQIAEGVNGKSLTVLLFLYVPIIEPRFMETR